MESEYEQIIYGDHCQPHKTPIGTPSGADFMCDLCEAGLTRWVPDNYYGIVWTHNDIAQMDLNRQAHSAPYRWQDSDTQEYKDKVWAKFVDGMADDLPNLPGMFFRAHVYAKGEWDYELDLMDAATEMGDEDWTSEVLGA